MKITYKLRWCCDKAHSYYEVRMLKGVYRAEVHFSVYMEYEGSNVRPNYCLFCGAEVEENISIKVAGKEVEECVPGEDEEEGE